MIFGMQRPESKLVHNDLFFDTQAGAAKRLLRFPIQSVMKIV